MKGRSSWYSLLKICLPFLSLCFKSVIVRMTYFLPGLCLMRCILLRLRTFFRDFVAMSFDQYNIRGVLDMIKGMSFMPGIGLG